MNKRNLLAIGGIAALGLALVALPASSARPQKPDASTIARLQQRIDELEAKLQAQAEHRQDQEVELADTEELEDSAPAFIVGKQDPAQIEVLPGIDKPRRLSSLGNKTPRRSKSCRGSTKMI